MNGSSTGRFQLLWIQFINATRQELGSEKEQLEYIANVIKYSGPAGDKQKAAAYVLEVEAARQMSLSNKAQALEFLDGLKEQGFGLPFEELAQLLNINEADLIFSFLAKCGKEDELC